jgi:general stress protein YciG
MERRRMDEKPKSRRGFAGISPERLREIASKGGKSGSKENRPFSQNRTLARSAGRKGGLVKPSEKRDVPNP